MAISIDEYLDKVQWLNPFGGDRLERVQMMLHRERVLNVKDSGCSM